MRDLIHVCMLLIGCTAMTMCKSGAVAVDDAQKIPTEEFLKQKLGDGTSVSYNVSHTYVVARETRGADHLRKRIRFIVVRVSDNSIVRSGSLILGYIKWIDDVTLELTQASPTGKPDGEKKEIIKINSEP